MVDNAQYVGFELGVAIASLGTTCARTTIAMLALCFLEVGHYAFYVHKCIVS